MKGMKPETGNLNGIIRITRSRFIEVLKEWRSEWDSTPHQFMINEAFRQSDPESYAEQVADHLLAKLLSVPAEQEGGAA
jgi:hypothetical protein